MEQVLNQIRLSTSVAAQQPEGVAALLEQLGSMEDLVSITAASALLEGAPVHDVRTLAVFIETYLQEVLIPIELPLIHKAFLHASRNECRELIVLDQSAAAKMHVEQFAKASRRVGHLHIRAMRPIRGERLVQRYLAAVESGEANGWHTIIYGITLAVFSLPARQGLMHYAYRTMGGFVQAAARSLRLTERECREIVGDLCDDVPQGIESILAGD
jgi:urease accessory protein UreF